MLLNNDSQINRYKYHCTICNSEWVHELTEDQKKTPELGKCPSCQYCTVVYDGPVNHLLTEEK